MGVPSWTESEETSSSRAEDTERKTKQPGGKPQSFDVAFSSLSFMIMVIFGLRQPEVSGRGGQIRLANRNHCATTIIWPADLASEVCAAFPLPVLPVLADG